MSQGCCKADVLLPLTKQTHPGSLDVPQEPSEQEGTAVHVVGLP